MPAWARQDSATYSRVRVHERARAMSRGRALVIVILTGLVAGLVAQIVDPGGPARAFCLFAAAVIVGELLVLRLEDGSAIPLSYAVFIVLVASMGFGEYVALVVGAELVALLLRRADRVPVRRVAVFV